MKLLPLPGQRLDAGVGSLRYGARDARVADGVAPVRGSAGDQP